MSRRFIRTGVHRYHWFISKESQGVEGQKSDRQVLWSRWFCWCHRRATIIAPHRAAGTLDKAKQQISSGTDLPDQVRYIPEVFFLFLEILTSGDSTFHHLGSLRFGPWSTALATGHLVLADESWWKKKKNHNSESFFKSLTNMKQYHIICTDWFNDVLSPYETRRPEVASRDNQSGHFPMIYRGWGNLFVPWR